MTQGMMHAATSNAGTLLCLAALALIPVPVAQGQLAHQGPVKAIALSQTLAPYDVSSVKQNKTGEQSWGMNLHDNIFTASNVPLEAMIGFAYDTRHVAGLTGPVTSLSFNVTAKVLPANGGAPPKLTDQQLQAMIIALLADRFHLKAHVESKIMPVYDLVVRNGGVKLKLDTSERLGGGWDIHGENTEKVLIGKNVSIADLAEALSDLAGRRVIDKTGLSGRTDITFKWTDDVAAEQGGANAISIFTAVEEQLGLKLQPSKGPVDTLVIDHVEMPSAN